MTKPRFEVYPDTAGKYRWRLKDSNGEKVASSGESFDSRSNAKRAAEKHDGFGMGSLPSALLHDVSARSRGAVRV